MKPSLSPDDAVAHAQQIARVAHAGQTDKQDRDYAEAHLAPIADALALWGPEAEALGWLHDIVEDTKWTFDGLRQEGFADDLVRAVDSMTRRSDEDYGTLIERSGADRLGVIGKIVDNAWNVLSGEDLALADPETAASMLYGRYLPARQSLLVAAGELRDDVDVLRMHEVDMVLRGHRDHLRNQAVTTEGQRSVSNPLGAATVDALRRSLVGIPGDLPVHMRMDSWAYNPWDGEGVANKDGFYLD